VQWRFAVVMAVEKESIKRQGKAGTRGQKVEKLEARGELTRRKMRSSLSGRVKARESSLGR